MQLLWISPHSFHRTLIELSSKKAGVDCYTIDVWEGNEYLISDLNPDLIAIAPSLVSDSFREATRGRRVVEIPEILSPYWIKKTLQN